MNKPMEAIKSLPVHHHSACYVLFPLGSLSPSWLFWNRIPLKPTLGGVCSFANCSVTYEETQSNRISWFCVRCFQKQSFLTFILVGSRYFVPQNSINRRTRTLSKTLRTRSIESNTQSKHSVAQTPLWEFVLDKSSSTQWGLIIELGQAADGSNFGLSFYLLWNFGMLCIN